MRKKAFILVEGTPDEVLVSGSGQGIELIALTEEGVKRAKSLGLKVIGPQGDLKLSKWPNEGGDFILFEIRGKEDEDRLVNLARSKPVLINAVDWKIIPLENVIAKLGGGKNLIALADDLDEAKSLLDVLEIGVEGIAVNLRDEGELGRFQELIEVASPLELTYAEVTEVREVGTGERVCVDTISLLDRGEGMLVGGSASFLFLIHSENIESPYTSPREFRVNAGAVSNYVMAPKGKTYYLSEVKAGVELLAVKKDGSRRPVSVGRAKVERRPMALVRARTGESEGWVILQLAETVPLVGEQGSIPVTELKPGDRVLVYLPEAKGRHFGTAVDEFIIEK